MKDLFHEEFETLDFTSDPEKSRIYINKFVENVTENNIKDILIPGTITQNTDLVVANAAYFKGQWASKFNADETIKAIFYSTPEKQHFVDMMTKKGVFNHGTSCGNREMNFVNCVANNQNLQLSTSDWVVTFWNFRILEKRTAFP